MGTGGESATVVVEDGVTPYYDEDGVTLYCADCRDVLPTLGQVDHVITDPPYSEHVHSKQWQSGLSFEELKRRYPRSFHGAGKHDELGFPPVTAEQRTALAEWCAANVTRWALMFCDLELAHLWRADIERAGFDYVRTCVWVKPDSAPQFTGDRPGAGAEAIAVAHRKGRKRWNGGGRRGVFEYGVNNYGKNLRAHPTAKPEALMSELVSLFTDVGEMICDPFAGSGTTLVAAKRLGRKAIGVEISERYCEVAVKRLRQRALPLWGEVTA